MMREGKNLVGVDIGTTSIKVCQLKAGRKGLELVRFGYEPRGSAVPDDKVDFLVPIGDATLYSFGVGYQIDAETRMDFGIGYLHSEFDADVRWEEDENGELQAIG